MYRLPRSLAIRTRQALRFPLAARPVPSFAVYRHSSTATTKAEDLTIPVPKRVHRADESLETKRARLLYTFL